MLACLASIGLASATSGYVRPSTDFEELVDGRSAEVTNLAGETLATVQLNGQVFVEELKLRLEEELGVPPRLQRLTVASWDHHLPGWVLLEDAFPEPGVANHAQLLVVEYCAHADLRAGAEEQKKRENRLQHHSLPVKELRTKLQALRFRHEAPSEGELRSVVADISSYIQHARNHGHSTRLELTPLIDILGYARHVFFQTEHGLHEEVKNLISAEPIWTNLQYIYQTLHTRCCDYRELMKRKKLVGNGWSYEGMGTDFSLVSTDALHSLETTREDLENLILPGRTDGSPFERFWADV